MKTAEELTPKEFKLLQEIGLTTLASESGTLPKETALKILNLCRDFYHAQFSQQPTLQSDSVDAKEYLKQKGVPTNAVGEAKNDEGYFTIPLVDLLIEFAGLSSKVKPINNDGWIPVEKELPTPYEKVFTYSPKGVMLGEWVKNVGQWRLNKCRGLFKNITHWQPLPSPPKV